MQNLMAVLSFAMAVIGGLAAMLGRPRDRQTLAALVGFAFLISFFIHIGKEAVLILQGACLIAFALSLLGGAIAIFGRSPEARTEAITTAIVSLATSILIVYLYL
ncbi:hypothetical protein [Desulfatiglans anilini]|uniref:hypothetical protein n=1 Tax=Desulfatiglans anilini TaxID=90728 RepID=UPI0003F5AC2B|nr:hypothetical protein [Desulfatiglans anilini]